MFWDRIDPIETPRLRSAVETAYAVFAGYRRGGPVVHCDCPSCMTADDAAAISTAPLREIPARVIAAYTGSAHGWDTNAVEPEFKALLPRYLDLVARCEPPSCDGLRICLDRLGEARYRERWAAHEIEAIDAFFDAFVEASTAQLGVRRWPAGWRLAFDMDEVLTMVARAGGDLPRALAAFDAAADPGAAMHMAALRGAVAFAEDGRPLYGSAYLKEHSEARVLLGAWLMRACVTDRILAISIVLDGGPYADTIAVGLLMG